MPSKTTSTKSSPRKAAAARANGAKSAGPKTAEGKARSAMNSLKHGVYSESLVLPNESPADLSQLRDYYFRRFQPMDPVEVDLVEVMIVSMWRLRRLSRIDTGILLREFQSAHRAVRGFDAMASTDQASLVALRHLNLNGNALSALDRQESKLYRHFSRAMNDLLKLRKNFPIDETPDPETALGNEPIPAAPASELTSDSPLGYPENPLGKARKPPKSAKVVPIFPATATSRAARGYPGPRRAA